MLKKFTFCALMFSSFASLSHSVKNDFTGVYGGLSLGVASSNMNFGGNISSKQKRSAEYGFMLGAGKQMDNNMYYGLEFSGSRLDNMTRRIDMGSYAIFGRLDHQMTLAPIVGYVLENSNIMPFVTAGYTRIGAHGAMSAFNMHGVKAGFGLNYMASKNLIIRGEYDVTRVYNNGLNLTMNAVKLGVIYKFDTGTF
jgi:opacity protein-like surface antigen